MADVELHPLVKGIRRKLGDKTVFKTIWGKPRITKAPDMEGRVLSEKQKAQNARFAAADRYGKNLPAEGKTAYRARAKLENRPVYSVIVRDFFRKPCVERIEVSPSGQPGPKQVLIHATDDTEVTAVSVVVRNDSGQVMESGAARLVNSDKGLWEYNTTTDLEAALDLTLEVTATDRPGNKDQRLQRVER
jgi:hypothetical protein